MVIKDMFTHNNLMNLESDFRYLKIKKLQVFLLFKKSEENIPKHLIADIWYKEKNIICNSETEFVLCTFDLHVEDIKSLKYIYIYYHNYNVFFRELGEQEALKKQNINKLENADETTKMIQEELESYRQVNILVLLKRLNVIFYAEIVD